MSFRVQPEWKVPNGTFRTGLTVSNSLTNRKDEFIPSNGKQVKWYICGPTVYDSSHLGHARTYLSFDIIRRILEDYFGYDVQVCMNITDIDDKIIMKSRKNYLYAEYVKRVTSLSTLKSSEGQIVISELEASIKQHLSSLEKKHNALNESISSGKRTLKEAGPELNLAKEKLEKAQLLSERLSSSLSTLEVGSELNSLLEDFKDALCDYLDSLNGAKLSHEVLNRITKEHSQFYEKEFLDDLKQLGIKTPDALTRVSEFVPEIIEMCEKIIANGFAYESEGSVYFDVAAFDKAKDHHYAKLVPSAYGNTELLAEGEGGLTTTTAAGGKKSANDFALWKKSKDGEPVWDSPWGLGRPGWHIECSAMAGKVLGQNLDIHAGGCDLKFPHHDNELAQSEAYFGASQVGPDGSKYSQWVNYFLHTGHLHIDNLKMSKSLKNFVTIREMLALHTPRQIRLLFLLQSWDNHMNFQRVGTVNEAAAKEKSFQEFFLRVEQVLGERNLSQGAADEHWNEKDFELNNFIVQTQQNVHAAMCNNFDTATVMKCLSDMVSKSNVYMEKNNQKKAFLLKKAAVYLTKILRVFGVIEHGNQEFGFGASSSDASSVNPRDIARPYVNALVEFRKQVRAAAKESGAAKELLMKLSDSLRDEIMPELDVKIVDDGEFGFFFVDREVLKKERAERIAAEESQKRAKKLSSLQKKQKDLQKWDEAAEAPQATIKRRFNVTITSGDVDSWPQVDDEGKELNKSQKKNIKKEWDKQEKNYAKYTAELASSPKFLEELRASVEELKAELGIN